MNDPLRNIYVDNRMESYEGYVPDDWGAKAFEAAKFAPALDHMLVDLVMSWRTTSYTASMPGVLVKTIQSSTLAYASFVSPDSSIIAFGEGVLVKLSRKVPELVENRDLRSRLMAELVTLADEFRTKRAAVTPEVPVGPIWDDFLKEDAFAMGVWSSQRVAYVAFYNAYEAFLVDCINRAIGVTQLRTSNKKEFNEALRTGFGTDISCPCWTHQELNNARLVRHALSHANGRETDDLKKQKHGIKVVEGNLQIVPHDNHNMLRRLRAAVDALVAAAVGHSNFQAPLS